VSNPSIWSLTMCIHKKRLWALLRNATTEQQAVQSLYGYRTHALSVKHTALQRRVLINSCNDAARWIQSAAFTVHLNDTLGDH